MATETLVDKACRYFREGRITVTECRPNGNVVVTVRGQFGAYKVVRDQGGWRCNCPAQIDRCAHVIGASLACDPEPAPEPDPASAVAASERRARVADLTPGDEFRFAGSPVVRTLANRAPADGDDLHRLWFADRTSLAVRGGQRVVILGGGSS